MSRPGFATGLGPTPWEFAGFLAWLAFVIVSMTAMVQVPAFNLVFWPTLWLYDLRKALRPGGSPDPEPRARLGPAMRSDILWDRDLDG